MLHVCLGLAIAVYNQITNTFQCISSIVAWGNVFGCKHMVWSLRIGGDVRIRQRTSRQTNMTHFENDYMAWIESVMYQNICEHAIAMICLCSVQAQSVINEAQ